MDFEEFLWATNNHVLADEIRSHYSNNEKMPESLHRMALDLRYWKNDNTAELEFVIQGSMNAIPAEVKKGTKVKAISMRTFVKEYGSTLSYRISSKN